MAQPNAGQSQSQQGQSIAVEQLHQIIGKLVFNYEMQIEQLGNAYQQLQQQYQQLQQIQQDQKDCKCDPTSELTRVK